jgi:hypothetical protein
MPDSITLGVLVASALAITAEAILKHTASHAVKESHQDLKATVARWSVGDVEALERAPTSASRQAVVAEIIDGLPANDQAAMQILAERLIAGLRGAGAPAIALDIGSLQANEVQLGDITVVDGMGVRIADVEVAGDFRTGHITRSASRRKRRR